MPVKLLTRPQRSGRGASDWGCKGEMKSADKRNGLRLTEDIDD
jgi:hypothetical protein